LRFSKEKKIMIKNKNFNKMNQLTLFNIKEDEYIFKKLIKFTAHLMYLHSSTCLIFFIFL